MQRALPKSVKQQIRLGRKKVAIITSRFNEEICEALHQGAKALLQELGIQTSQIETWRVPGAFEIPLAAQVCARSKKYAGIVCVGAVIRGETPHFDYVCKAVVDGLVRVQLDETIPVGFGVITTDNLAQALARARPDALNKGREAAIAMVQMIVLKDFLKNS